MNMHFTTSIKILHLCLSIMGEYGLTYENEYLIFPFNTMDK